MKNRRAMMLVSCCVAALWLAAAPPVLSQTTVLLTQRSDPAGLITEASTPVQSASLVSTVAAPLETGGYRFTHWTVNSVRQQDTTGRGMNPATFTIYENTDCVGHYLSAAADTDTDGIPDWFEVHFSASLTNGATSDREGDGFTFLEEFWRDTHPNLVDSIQDGGVSRRRSDAFPIDLAGLASFRVESLPAGIVAQTTYAPTGTVVQTPTAPEANSGYTFGQWLVNGQRQADGLGFAINPASFVLPSNTVATAYYVPSTAESDADGVLDWFEWRYYGGLSGDADGDSDGDGFTLRDEWWRGTHPNLVDSIQDGGVSRRRSESFPIDLAGLASFRVESLPAGIVAQTTYAPTGTVVQTLTAPETSSGYTFGQWLVNGQRQTDGLGFGINPASFVLLSNTVATASYYPSAEDSDGDGMPDWFEWRYYGGLSGGEGSDSDEDGFTMRDEWWWGTHPNLVDSIQEGGISRRRSGGLYINLQPFERVEYVLMDGLLTRFFAFGPPDVTGFDFGTNSVPALGDWDGDGDLDLFVSAGGGLMFAFENIGTRYTMNLRDRTTGFSALASAWSGLTNPVVALGDWSGDGKVDLAIGGDTDSIRLISSTGTFTGPQSPEANTALSADSASARPALGDVTSDGRADLLVLLADGTVSLYTNTGSAVTPFVAPAGVTNLLGEAVPNATGIVIADINYDGWQDVLVADNEGRIWEFQKSDGGFVLQSKVWAGTGDGFATALTLGIGDIEGDGDVDALGGFAQGGLVCLRDPRVAIPSSVRAYPGTASIRLQWDADRQSRIVGYYVYRGTSIDGPYVRLTPVALLQPAYEDTAVSVGVTYYYYVTAVTGAMYPGNSAPVLVESRASEKVSAQVGLVVLWMPDYFGRAGSNTILQINTPQASGIAGNGLEIRVTYDPTLLIPLSQVSPGEVTVEKTALTEGLTIADNGTAATGEIRISGSGAGTITGEGNLFDVRFRVANSAPMGARDTNAFSYVWLGNGAGAGVGVDASDKAVFTVSNSYSPGDMNGDGVLEMGDFTLAMKLAVGQRQPTAYELAAGDMNGNGVIDKDDAHLILRMIHGKDVNPK